jgi:NTP pyrophosphatase (non-canonical NTP hydrolase)
MDFETYQRDVFRTVRPDMPERERLLLAALGLCGESGEVAENVKKLIFHGHPVEGSVLRDELGDVLWYFVFLCDTVGVSVEEVMEANVAKRRKRYPDGFSSERSIQREDTK